MTHAWLFYFSTTNVKSEDLLYTIVTLVAVFGVGFAAALATVHLGAYLSHSRNLRSRRDR